ncbi:MAG: hypothetical protein K5675_08795, partial [Lachnospiraceae bacterium]|nr:hypothetical protein [Lachnospiraceae bacterium]
RKGKKSTIANLMMVWVVTGLWHGGTINFVIWGVILGVIIVCEKFLWKETMEKHSIIGRILVIIIIPLTWLIFAMPNLKELGLYFTKLVNIFSGTPLADLSKYFSMYGPYFIVGSLLLIPKVGNMLLQPQRGVRQSIRVCFLFIIFAMSLYFSGISAGNPFLYYSF